MQEDRIAEQLEHEEFMASLHKLQEQIFYAWLGRKADRIADAIYDVRKFGDEPVFTGLLFDKILEESHESRREDDPS